MERKRGDVSKEIVQDKDLFDLSHKITAEWKNVARVLNIEEAHIYRIQKDNDDCIQEQICQMLFFWRKKGGDDATYSVLSQALKRAGRKDLADELSSDQGLLPRECEQTRLRGISHEGQRNRDGEDNTDRPMTLSNEASSRKRVEDCNSQSDSAALTPSGRNDDESKPCQPFSDITRTKNQDFMPTVNIKSEHDSHPGEGINDRKTEQGVCPSIDASAYHCNLHRQIQTSDLCTSAYEVDAVRAVRFKMTSRDINAKVYMFHIINGNWHTGRAAGTVGSSATDNNVQSIGMDIRGGTEKMECDIVHITCEAKTCKKLEEHADNGVLCKDQFLDQPPHELKSNNESERSASMTKCLQHPKYDIDKYCDTCNKEVCAECVFGSHMKSCVVVALDDVPKKVQKERKRLLELLSSTEVRFSSWKEWSNRREQFTSNIRESIQSEIREYIKKLHDQIDRKEIELLAAVDKKEQEDEKDVSKSIENVSKLLAEVERLRNTLNNSIGNDYRDLITIKSIQNEVNKVTTELRMREALVKSQDIDVSLRKVYSDKLCCEVLVGKLIGGVLIRPNQIVHILDERRISGGVRLICFNPKYQHKEYWRYLVHVDNLLAPVIISPTEIWYDGLNQLLFAVGSSVYIIHPTTSESAVMPTYISVSSVTCLKVEDLGEANWITSISGCNNPNDEIEDEFLISDNSSSVLRELNVSGKVTKHVIFQDISTSNNVSCIAYCNYMIAMIFHESNEVMLLTNDGKAKQTGTLRPPVSKSNLLPKNVIFTYGTWIVLWISDGVQREWTVVNYAMTGEILKVCDKGVSFDDRNLPVSVDQWDNRGVISFANNSVKMFNL